ELSCGLRGDDPRKVRDTEIGRRQVYLQNREQQLIEGVFEAEAKAMREGDEWESARASPAAALPDLKRMLADARAGAYLWWTDDCWWSARNLGVYAGPDAARAAAQNHLDPGTE